MSKVTSKKSIKCNKHTQPRKEDEDCQNCNNQQNNIQYKAKEKEKINI